MVANARANVSDIMKRATEPFDYEAFNVRTGNRITIPLDGIFPFEFRNKTIESIDRDKVPHPWFPPDSKIEVRILLFPGNMSAVWTERCEDFDVYMENAAAPALVGVAGQIQPRITFLEASMEYESLILKEEEHVKVMNKFYLNKESAIYDFDIPRSQHQALPGNTTFTENNFQIAPYCRLVYIFFNLRTPPSLCQSAESLCLVLAAFLQVAPV